MRWETALYSGRTVLLKWPLTAELLSLSRSVAGGTGWHILHRDEGNIFYGRWFWTEKRGGKRAHKIIISNRVKLILYLAMSWQRVVSRSFSWSTWGFSSGWEELTNLSGYYYNFKYLKLSKIFTLLCNDIVHYLYSTGV